MTHFNLFIVDLDRYDRASLPSLVMIVLAQKSSLATNADAEATAGKATKFIWG